MPSALAFIGGGLLQGIGKGLVEDGKAKRERALADLEHKRTLERDEKQAEGRRGLLTQQLKSDRDLAARREAGATKRLGLNIGSREKIASEVATIAAGKPSKATDTSAAEKRFWDIAVETATKPGVDEDGEPTLFETTDWNAVVLDMEARNLPELAATARRRAAADQKRQDRKVALPRAVERVEAMVSTNPFTTDATDFKQYGGSREKALDAILLEEMKKLADARSGKAAPTTRPAGGDPDVDEGPPADYPNATRGKSGSWYIPDPDRPGEYIRLDPPATPPPARETPRGLGLAGPGLASRPPVPPVPAAPQQRPAASAAIIDPQTAGPGAAPNKPINAMTLIEIADLIQSRGDSLTPKQLRQVTQRLKVLRR